MLNTAVSGAIDLTARAIQTTLKDNASAAGRGGLELIKSQLKGQSLVSVAKQGRVEPLVMVDADCTNLEYIGDVMQTVQSLFAGYYLQALNLLANNVAGATAAEVLAPFNPKNGLGFGIESHSDAKDHHTKWRLPTRTNRLTPSLESNDKPQQELRTSDSVLQDVSQAAALSVGKMYNVTLRDAGGTLVVPIAIRLLVNILPSKSMTTLFTYRDAFDMSLKERWHAYRAGQLGFIKDLILCNDLIDKYRRMAIVDKTGIGQKILNREASIVGNALAGTSSISMATNIAVISNDTLDSIEGELGGKFTSTKVRQALFENTNLMLLVIVDKHWERVTIYTRDIDGSTTLPAKMLKSGSKSSAADVTDIMKAYMMGANPQF